MSNATQEIIRVCEALPEDKQVEVADFARFLLARQEDEAWERRLPDSKPRPKLEAFLRESAEGDAPLDLTRCEFTCPAQLLALLRNARSASTRSGAPRVPSLHREPRPPSLRFKKLGGYDSIWSVRTNEQYRAVGERHGDTIFWS